MEPADGIALLPGTTLGELAARHGGRVDPGSAPLPLARVATVAAARAGDLAPLLARRHLDEARGTAAALLVDESLADLCPPGRRWIHGSPAFALAGVLAELEPAPPPDRRADAHVSPDARLGEGVRIGPGAVVMAGATIGDGSTLEPNAVVYGGARLGARVHVGAGAVIGRPGFGWASGRSGELRRMPQLGGVVVEDDVEIGPLATVDAGTLSPTRIGKGARLDAHVHVGHNVVVGPSCLVAAQSGFAGSVVLGAGVLVGGQAGVADHVTIGDGARLAAKSGVIGDVPAGATFAGYPAVDRARWLRAFAKMLRGGSR